VITCRGNGLKHGHMAELKRGHIEVARAALEGGARLIQLREKRMEGRALWGVARAMRALTQKYGAALIVNDRVDIALAAEADGVHLGQEDIPLAVARRLLGPEAVIGVSVSSEEEAEAAEKEGASYVSVGSIFPTASKPDAGEAIGVEPLSRIKRMVGLPVLAIGGVNCDNVQAVIRAGANGVAVISAIAEAEDMVEATRRLKSLIAEARGGQGVQEQFRDTA
jgi:thiamine-phosphate pyrophosphorylase